MDIKFDKDTKVILDLVEDISNIINFKGDELIGGSVFAKIAYDECKVGDEYYVKCMNNYGSGTIVDNGSNRIFCTDVSGV